MKRRTAARPPFRKVSTCGSVCAARCPAAPRLSADGRWSEPAPAEWCSFPCHPDFPRRRPQPQTAADGTVSSGMAGNAGGRGGASSRSPVPISVLARQHGSFGDHIAQLAHVARPAMAFQNPKLLRQRKAQARVGLLQEMLGQRNDVFRRSRSGGTRRQIWPSRWYRSPRKLPVSTICSRS